MPDQDAHLEKLALLLPSGPPWEAAGLFALLRGLAGDPARVDAAAAQHLEDFLPDTVDGTGAYLADWERVLALGSTGTNAERGARIRAKLYGNGDPSRANIEAILRIRRGDDASLRVLQGLTPPPACGAGYCGQPDWGPQGAATWICEYMPNALAVAPDAAWTDVGGAASTANAAQSPRTEATTATQIALGGGQIRANLSGTANGDEVYVSIWLKAATAATVAIGISGRDATPHGAAFVDLTTTWVKYTFRTTIGSGASTPYVYISGSGTIYASYGMAGIADSDFEDAAIALMPINTTGIFEVEGENA